MTSSTHKNDGGGGQFLNINVLKSGDLCDDLSGGYALDCRCDCLGFDGKTDDAEAHVLHTDQVA